MSKFLLAHRLLPLLVSFAVVSPSQVRDIRVKPVDSRARQAFERQVKVALVVGVGAYPPESGLSALKYPERDATTLAKELENQGYLVRTLIDASATRGIVRRTINELAVALDPDQGSYLFFFAGHGFEQNGKNYLATFGVTSDDLELEGFAVSEVERLLRDSKAKQSIMFIDACRNDPLANTRSGGVRTFITLRAAQGLHVLYSTRAGHVSYESAELRHGIFTHFLVRGLRGDAAGGDGLVTFRDISDYVIEKVRSYSVRMGQVQVPYEAGESSGDFLLGRSGSSSAPAVLPVPALTSLHSVGPRNGDVNVNPKDGQRYNWIPPGKFSMGCSVGDRECVDDEKPTHEVTISSGFWMGQSEVIQEAFKKVVGRNPSHFQGTQLPVESVTWAEAVEYCRSAGGRLPTEAEWEYAARAGSGAERYGELGAIAWYGGNSGRGPHEVGVKAPNQWGLFDVLGNVWEWTADRYEEHYYQESQGPDPVGPASGQMRVMRGGAWDNSFHKNFRLSRRGRGDPAGRYVNTGFRCVWSH